MDSGHPFQMSERALPLIPQPHKDDGSVHQAEIPIMEQDSGLHTKHSSWEDCGTSPLHALAFIPIEIRTHSTKICLAGCCGYQYGRVRLSLCLGTFFSSLNFLLLYREVVSYKWGEKKSKTCQDKNSAMSKVEP